jgi:adenylate kinase
VAAAPDVARTIVLLGPPGAGKGTQARHLAAWSGLQHVSTGDLLRRAVASETPLGLQVRPILEAGRLVDDSIVAALVGERLDDPESGGLLLDGYPRTIAQAERLASLLAERRLPPPLVVEIRVPDEAVVTRLAQRRTCPSCGPRPPGECECGGCGGSLTARPDDAEDVVRERLRVYAAQTAPLTQHYAKLGLLREVDGNAAPAVVERRIREAVAAD